MGKVPFRFKKGDHMCISQMAQIFQWGHDEKWTRDIFEVYQPFRWLGWFARFARRRLEGNFLRSRITKGGPNPSVEIVSPIAQSLNRAKYMLKGNGGRTKHKTKGPIKRKARSHSSSHKGGSQRRKMSKRKKNKTEKRKSSKKKKGKDRWSMAYVPKCVKKTKGKKKTLDHDNHTYQVGCYIWGNEC